MMTLEKFIEEQQVNLTKFRLQWVTAMQSRPRDYPAEMGFQDWGMQYIAWLENEFGKEVEDDD